MNTKQQIEKLRFQTKFQRGSEQDCWLWKACTGRGGYGNYRQSSIKGISAHRYAYFLHYGVDPGNLHVLHTCDTPACVNPHHLKLGTNTDNMIDREVKGRGCRPGHPDHPQTKLNPTLVRRIRARFAAMLEARGSVYGIYAELGRQYGTRAENIAKVVKGLSWN